MSREALEHLRLTRIPPSSIGSLIPEWELNWVDTVPPVRRDGVIHLTRRFIRVSSSISVEDAMEKMFAEIKNVFQIPQYYMLETLEWELLKSNVIEMRLVYASREI